MIVAFAFSLSLPVDAADDDSVTNTTVTAEKNTECNDECVVANGVVYVLSEGKATVANPATHPMPVIGEGGESTESTYEGEYSIPEYVIYETQTYTVTTIAEGAFSVENSSGSDTTSVILPETLTTIEDTAFMNCSKITTLTIPSGVTYIGKNAFAGCTGLTSLEIPAGVTYIGKNAFAGCTGLTSLEIPAGVQDLGFTYSTNTSAGPTADGDASYIGIDFGALAGWNNAKNVTFTEGSPYTNDNGILYKGTVLVACLDPEITSVNVREGTTEISTSAFLNCTKLANVTLPEELKTIGDDAFNLVPGVDTLDTIIPPLITIPAPDPADVLVQMNIPASVTSIGNNFLKGALKNDGTSILLMEGTTAPSIGTGMFATESGKTATLNIYYPADAQNAYDALFGTYMKTENAFSLSAESSVNLSKGDSTDVSITSQVPSGFSVSAVVADSSIAAITLNGNTLSIQGLADGSTTITLKISDETTTLIDTDIAVSVSTITYTVSFDSNGGTGTMNPAIVEVGTSYTAPACGFTKDGFEFSGWNTAPDGSGTSYAVDSAITVSDDLVLYAIWEHTEEDEDTGNTTTITESTVKEDGNTVTTTITTVTDNKGQTVSTGVRIESSSDDGQINITSSATVIGDDVVATIEASNNATLSDISDVIDKTTEALSQSVEPAYEITIKNITVGGSVTLGTDVLNNLIEKADSGTPSIIIDNSDDGNLEQAQIAAKGDDVGFELTALITYSDGSTDTVSQLGGAVTVRLPYVSGTMGGDPEGLGVWYIDDYGNREFMESVYDSVDECFVFETNHFSLYVISEIPKTIDPDNPPFNPGWDDDDYVPLPPVIIQDSGDDDSTKVVACAAAAVVAALMTAFLIHDRRHSAPPQPPSGAVYGRPLQTNSIPPPRCTTPSLPLSSG